MDLFILRHAIAEKRNARLYKIDGRRPLSPKGAKKMKLVSKNLKEIGVSFDRIVTSPYTRARQTAQIVADTFKFKPKKLYVSKNLIPGKSCEDLASELRFLSRRGDNLLLVGHEPHLSEFISYLLIEHPMIPLTLKKGGLCYLSMPGRSVIPGSGTLEGLWAPSLLQRIR